MELSEIHNLLMSERIFKSTMSNYTEWKQSKGNGIAEKLSIEADKEAYIIYRDK